MLTRIKNYCSRMYHLQGNFSSKKKIYFISSNTQTCWTAHGASSGMVAGGENRREAQVADYRVEPRERRRGDEVEEAGSSKLTTFEKNKRAEE